MSSVQLRDLRGNLAQVARSVSLGGEEAIIVDGGSEVAVLINMADYERLHEHADALDALRLREMRTREFDPLTMADMLRALGVPPNTVGAA